MSRFVVISDLHIHPWTAFAKGDGLENTRLQQSLRVLDSSLDFAAAHEIPWLFPGDLVHTAGYALNVVLAGVSRVFAKYPDVVKIAVWGNHDARGVGGLISLDQTVFPALAQGLPNFIVLQPGVTVEHEGLLIAGAGYQPRADLLELGDGADIGLFHQTIRGSVSPGGFVLTEGIESEALMAKYRIALVGHIHHKQQLDAPKGQALLIPGSPEHHNFGDLDEHGWWVLDVPKAKKTNPKVEFMAGGSPQFVTVDSPDQVKNDDNFYRVRVVLDKHDLPENATFIAPEPTSIEERGLLHGVSEVEEILQVWLQTAPPPTPAGLEHADDCPIGLGGFCECPALDQHDLGEYLTTGRQLLEAQDPVRLRPMRARRLHLKNFCSYEDQEFEVQDGLWLVVGKARDYESNGAGKTTLVGEALYWLVFGLNTKGLSADEITRTGETHCEVSSTLYEVNGPGVLEVARSRVSGKPSLRVTEDGVPWEAASSDEMTRKLTRYLGLTPEIYQNLGYFSQEKLLLFASSTDGERKNVLADLIGLSSYNEAATAAATSAGDFDRKREQAEAYKHIRTEQLEEKQAGLLAGQERTTLWDNNKAERVAGLESAAQAIERSNRVPLAKEKLTKVIDRASALQARFASRWMDALPAVEESIRERLVRDTEGRLEVVAEQRRKLIEGESLTRFGGPEKARPFVASVPQVASEHAKAIAARNSVRLAKQAADVVTATARGRKVSALQQVTTLESERAAALVSLGEGVCPTCQQAISDEHRTSCLAPLDAKLQTAKEAVTTLGGEVEQAEASASDLAASLAEAESAVTKFAEYDAALATLEAALRRLDELDDERSALERQNAGQIEQAKQQASAQQDAAVQAYNTRKAQAVQRAERFVRSLEAEHTRQHAEAQTALAKEQATVNPHINTLAELVEGIQETQEKLTRLDRDIAGHTRQAAIYNYWKKGFSKQGIQSLLMEEISSLFNKNRGAVFPVLTQGVYDVQFSTISRTRQGEPREKTEFIVYQHGEQIPYGYLSGGQRRRVDVGIMLVLAQSVSEWMGVPGILGILTLDEVFGFLDSSGAEGLMEALQQIQQQIPTIFAVTHDSHLQSLFPQMIHVAQDEHGVSRVAA